MMRKLFITLFCLTMAVSSAKAQHRLGEVMEFNGVKGMVFKLDKTGEHGLVMTVKKCKDNWLINKDAKFETGSFYEDDGEKNLAIIETYIKDNNQQWEDFPYFNWCHSLGEGWYPPANDELMALVTFINGEGLTYNHKNARKISKMLKDADGDGVFDSFTKSPFLYFSSTEAENGWVFVMSFTENLASSVAGTLLPGSGPKGKFELKSYQKSQIGGKILNIVGNRAVHKF